MSFLYINYIMPSANDCNLLLHIQFEYFLLSLADLLSVVLQLQSDQEWQEQALLFFTQPHKENFQLFPVFHSMTLAVGLLCMFGFVEIHSTSHVLRVVVVFVTESWLFTCFFLYL